jgi:hypothetical protein
MSYEKVVEYNCDSCQTREKVDNENEIPSGWYNVSDEFKYFTAEYEGEISICGDCVVEVAMDLFKEYVIAEG